MDLQPMFEVDEEDRNTDGGEAANGSPNQMDAP